MLALTSYQSIADSLASSDPRIKAFETGLVDRMMRGKQDAKLWSIAERLAAHEVPGVGVAIIEKGKVIWSRGYGTRLNGKGKTRVFHHGGANESYRAWIEGHPNSGSGIVVLTNGSDGHWIYSELRKSAEDAFGWAVKSDGGFEEPVL